MGNNRPVVQLTKLYFEPWSLKQTLSSWSRFKFLVSVLQDWDCGTDLVVTQNLEGLFQTSLKMSQNRMVSDLLATLNRKKVLVFVENMFLEKIKKKSMSFCWGRIDVTHKHSFCYRKHVHGALKHFQYFASSMFDSAWLESGTQAVWERMLGVSAVSTCRVQGRKHGMETWRLA